ncbi:hypothetical protein GCM10028775_27910 [Catellatospora paridis]
MGAGRCREAAGGRRDLASDLVRDGAVVAGRRAGDPGGALTFVDRRIVTRTDREVNDFREVSVVA